MGPPRDLCVTQVTLPARPAFLCTAAGLRRLLPLGCCYSSVALSVCRAPTPVHVRPCVGVCASPAQLWWVPLKCCPLGLGPTITDMMLVRLSLISPKAFSCRHCLCVSLHRLLHPCMCSQRMAREQKDLLMLAHPYTAASLRGCVTALLVLSQPVPDGTSMCMPQVVCVCATHPIS